MVQLQERLAVSAGPRLACYATGRLVGGRRTRLRLTPLPRAAAAACR